MTSTGEAKAAISNMKIEAINSKAGVAKFKANFLEELDKM